MYSDAQAVLRTNHSSRFRKPRSVGAPLRNEIRDCSFPPRGAPDTATGNSKTSVIACVSIFPLFAGLPIAIHRELVGTAVPRSFSERQLIFRQDDPVRYVHVIASGAVKITQLTESGSEVILRLDRAGNAIDDLGTTYQQTHATSAFAIRACRILTWRVENFAAMTERFPVIERNISRILLRRLRSLENSICDLGTARVPQRLARVLLQLTQQDGFKYDSIGLSREELAQMIGTSAFMVSRFLSEWSERGIVHVSRHETIIENRASLVGLAEMKETPRFSLRTAGLVQVLDFKPIANP